MPTYEYRCVKCKHTWELFQSMTAAAVKVCPACGKKSAVRLIGMGAAVVFKGSGFYQTDYRSKGYQEAAANDKPAGEGGGTEAKRVGDAAATSDAKLKTPAAPTGAEAAPAHAGPKHSGPAVGGRAASGPVPAVGTVPRGDAPTPAMPGGEGVKRASRARAGTRGLGNLVKGRKK
jgi:putative FmdB family regulatory protein